MTTPEPDAIPLTILGAGYVGRALQRRFPDAAATRRRPDAGELLFRFDLDDPDSWDLPPLSGCAVVWTFPAAPLDRVQAFHDRRLRDAAAVIVLGSTSAYRVTDAGQAPTVTEDSPLDLSQPRVAGEEWLRGQGVTVLQLAGIIGPGRDPEQWLRQGRIRDGAKIVNLIHVDDIVAVIEYLLAYPAPGERINVANGEPVAWRDLVARFQADGRIARDFRLPESGVHESGKRVDCQRLHTMLPNHDFIRP